MYITFKQIKKMTINNVSIGQRFKHGKNLIAIVMDFYEVRSLTSNKVKQYICIAKLENSLATNLFDIPFSTVVRNKI